MRNGHFERLRTILLDRGVSTRYADRLIAELQDHYTDAEAERLAAGESPAAAGLTACELLGADAAIAAQVLARPELRGHCSGLRAALRPMLATLVVNEAVAWPGFSTPAVARWGASITFGSIVTFALLLLMAQTTALGV